MSSTEEEYECPKCHKKVIISYDFSGYELYIWVRCPDCNELMDEVKR